MKRLLFVVAALLLPIAAAAQDTTFYSVSYIEVKPASIDLNTPPP